MSAVQQSPWLLVSGMFCSSCHGSQTGCCWLPAAEAPPAEPEQAQAYAALRIAPPEEFMASGIKSLAFVAGAKSGGQHALLALGGQRLEEPDLLHLLPLQPATPEVLFALSFGFLGLY